MDSIIDINAIMRFLPHRYPFLLVDRILSLEVGKEIVGLKNVTINEPFFQGHFPGKPIMPGVLILEALGQTGGVLAYNSHPEANGNKVLYFTGIDKVRFRKPVVPGDQLRLTVKILKLRSKVVKMAGTASVADQLVAEAEMMAAIGE